MKTRIISSSIFVLFILSLRAQRLDNHFVFPSVVDSVLVREYGTSKEIFGLVAQIGDTLNFRLFVNRERTLKGSSKPSSKYLYTKVRLSNKRRFNIYRKDAYPIRTKRRGSYELERAPLDGTCFITCVITGNNIEVIYFRSGIKTIVQPE